MKEKLTQFQNELLLLIKEREALLIAEENKGWSDKMGSTARMLDSKIGDLKARLKYL